MKTGPCCSRRCAVKPADQARSAVVLRWLARGLALSLGALTLLPLSAAGPLGGRGGRGGDDMRETLTLLMMVRMKNELGLTDPQYEQVLPKVEARERSREANARDRRDRLAKLREVLAREGVKDAEVIENVDGILALDEADRKQDVSFVADLRKILSPRQQGQLLLFRQRFRSWLETRMRDAQELRRRYGRRGLGGRGGAGTAPDASDDDDSGSDAPGRP